VDMRIAGPLTDDLDDALRDAELVHASPSTDPWQLLADEHVENARAAERSD
jgi:hypothetical protein